MELIEVYIQEVTRRLPEKSREDIGLELRSTIEDMLPDDYGEEDVNSVLEKLGNPATLASEYRDQPMHLIGPRYFDAYVSLLKMIIPIVSVIALISMTAEYFINYNGEDAILDIVLHIMGEGIWGFIQVGIQVFFWLTLIFAIIERTDKGKYKQPLSTSFKEWTPKDLKNIPHIPKKKAIKKLEVFGYFMWIAIWVTLYFNADRLIGIYEDSGTGLEFVIPAFNQEILLSYWPLVLVVIVLEIGLALYKFIKSKWTMKMAIYNAILALISTTIFIVIFSNPNLLHQEFLIYLSDLFNIKVLQLKGRLVGGIIFIFVLSEAINIFDGCRKARVK